MTRVSLREAYDNKDVVAQILSIRDTAESAVDTSEQAVTTANTASDHVDALVPQVEGAVANANSASASAQASAQTVAGYENRLANVEDNVEDLSGDLNAVTLRVQTAEGQIVTIQGRVTALETADGQNVKINAINDYAVGLTGNQKIYGLKIHEQPILTDIAGVPIQRTFGYYKTHNLGALSGNGTWYINIIFSWRYSIILAHIEAQFANNAVSNIVVTKLVGEEPVGNTKIALDIIDGNVYLVVHRVAQSNVYSRVVVCDVQKGASSNPMWSRLDEGEFYTPAGELIEGDLV